MWPFFPPYFNPFFFRPRRVARSLGTYKVSTTGISDTGDITDLHIPASVFNALPNECILLFNITQGIPLGRASNDVNVVAGTRVTRRFTVVDSQNTVVTGTDIPLPTEKQVYLNKSTGTFRILNYLTAAPTGGGGVEAASVPSAQAAKIIKN